MPEKRLEISKKEERKGSGVRRISIAFFLVIVVGIPVIVTVLYNIYWFDYDVIPSGDLLGYFGVCVGLFGSVIMYFDGRERERLEERKERVNQKFDRRPRLSIEVSEAANPYMKITIVNIGSQIISDMFLADRHIVSFLRPGESVNKLISYENCQNEAVIDLSKDASNTFDGHKWPKELKLTVCDQDNDVWDVVATRCVDGGSFFYLCEVDLNGR